MFGSRGAPQPVALKHVDIDTLARAQVGFGTLQPPIELWGSTPAAAPAPLSVIGTAVDGEVLGFLNIDIPQPGPIICYFVRDVTLCGSGYLMHGDDLVTDSSDLSAVAAEWLERPAPDSPLAMPHLKERWVEGLSVVAFAPGFTAYGHWLLDFVPRFMIARDVLGLAFASARLVIPHDAPAWARSMIEEFTGAKPAQFELYHRGRDRLALRQACVPSYVHNAHSFHPYAQSVFAAIGTRPLHGGPRKLCVSRTGLDSMPNTAAAARLANRVVLENAAGRFGYEIVRPETMPIAQQAALFASASHVIGEFGSALHNTVFGPAGQHVGFIRCPTPTQLRIGAMRRQPSTVLMPTAEEVTTANEVSYTLTNAEIAEFLHANEVCGRGNCRP